MKKKFIFFFRNTVSSDIVALPVNTNVGIHLTKDGDFVKPVNCENTITYIRCPIIQCGTIIESDKNQKYRQFKQVYYQNLKNNLTTNEFVGDVRVIGGETSEPGKWPSIVGITKNGRFNCGGVIMNELWIITAAHCVEG